MKRKIGIGIIVIGVILLLGAGCLFAFNTAENLRAGKIAETTVSDLEEKISANDTEDKSLPDPYDPIMSECVIDGNSYIGFIEIPQLNLKLPVMSDWNYEKLNISPCRYSGSVKTNDLVIAAHNYSQHFGNISQLADGGNVYFTDVDGIITQYQITELDVLSPYSVEDMTSGEYDLTLFTCNYSGQSRITVRCDKII